MTVNYPDSFSISLLKWRGSLYKAIWRDLFVFYILYYCMFTINVMLPDGSSPSERNTTEFMATRWKMSQLIDWFERGTNYIPLTFLLGFFVAGVVARWWEQFNWISWPDKLLKATILVLPGDEYKGLRRTIVRWATLQAAIVWRSISVRTKKRFPMEKHFVISKLMTEEELRLYERIDGTYGKWFVPTIWIQNAFRQLHLDKKIDSIQLEILWRTLMSYRDGFAMLLVYDWITIPLVYTQVVAIATYGYFLLCVIARQPKMDDYSCTQEVAIYFPIFTTLQMIFYLGWLKVGQFLLHPFGEDDDDFELNWILDRNTAVAYILSDDLCDQLPPVGEERFEHLPHTRASVKIRDIVPPDSMAVVHIKEAEMDYLPIEETNRLLSEKDEGIRAKPFNRLHSVVRTLSQRRKARDAHKSEGDKATAKTNEDEVHELKPNNGS